MSEHDDIDDIREQKLRELEERASAGTESDAAGATGQSTGSTPGEPVHVEGPDHLDELTSAHDVVLVDFYADWCGPCQMLEPVLESIADDTAAVVAKVDVDRHQDLAGQAGVQGVPTLLLYAGGQPTERLVGVQDESKIRELIARYA